MITIYSKLNCPSCDKAKAHMNSKKLEFNEILISDVTDIKTISLSDFRQKYPLVKAVPFLITNTEIIGGYNELIKKFA